jgi:hypothetical protein
MRGSLNTIKILLLLLMASPLAMPQVSPFPLVTTAPTGSCSVLNQMFQVRSTGQVYVCASGTWTGVGTASEGAGNLGIQYNGTLVGTRPAINLISGTGITQAVVDDPANTRVNVTSTGDTSILLDRDTGASGVDNTCIPASASGTVMTCTMAGGNLTSYSNGMRLMFRPDANCSGTPTTLNINTRGARKIYAADGTTSAACTSGQSYWLTYNPALDGATGGWTLPPAPSSTPTVNHILRAGYCTTTPLYVPGLWTNGGTTTCYHSSNSGYGATWNYSAIGDYIYFTIPVTTTPVVNLTVRLQGVGNNSHSYTVIPDASCNATGTAGSGWSYAALASGWSVTSTGAEQAMIGGSTNAFACAVGNMLSVRLRATAVSGGPSIGQVAVSW